MKRKLLNFLLVILLVLGAYFVGSYTGDNKNTENKTDEKSTVKTLDFSLVGEVYNTLKDNYLRSIDEQKAIYGAVKGMVANSADPYTTFLTPSESNLFFDDLKGEFSGIGAELSIQDGKLIVVTPLEGSPAQTAGLKPKDQILSIDGVGVDSLSFEDSVNRIRGEKGSKVKLVIVRLGDGQFEKEIVRDNIKVQSVTSEVMQDKLVYLKINQFGDDTLDLATRQLNEKIQGSTKGIVIDLRNNPGGYLDASIAIASLFTKGVIVKEQDKNGKIRDYNSVGNVLYGTIPLAILVNEGSASASEILAGALQDYGRAKIIGTKTYGKGSVQDLKKFDDGSTLKVTIAEWLTPRDRLIDKKGIEPDIIISDDEATPTDEVINKTEEILLTL